MIPSTQNTDNSPCGPKHPNLQHLKPLWSQARNPAVPQTTEQHILCGPEHTTLQHPKTTENIPSGPKHTTQQYPKPLSTICFVASSTQLCSTPNHGAAYHLWPHIYNPAAPHNTTLSTSSSRDIIRCSHHGCWYLHTFPKVGRHVWA